MIEILNYFEELDEAIYISDMKTHDIIYLNKTLRNHYGYKSYEEYLDVKCYELFFAADEPCSICNNKELQYKEWCSGIYTNNKQKGKYLSQTRKFYYEGNQYRIGVFLNIDEEISDNEEYIKVYKSIVNEHLKEVISKNNIEKAIEYILENIGVKYACDRVYIFELNDEDCVSNTYEWCGKGVSSQKEILQNEPIESVDWWLESFNQNGIVFIEDVEEIKKEFPTTYSALKPQNILSLVAVPIYINDRFFGFVGIDNPDKDNLHLIQTVLNITEKMINALLRARILFISLDKTLFHDHLTDAFNRNAMDNHFADTSKIKSVGVINFNIIGLKQINNTLGYKAGDFLIQKCYKYICQLLKEECIYRIDGNEFIFIKTNCNRAEFQRQVRYIKEHLKTYQYQIVFGSTWSDQKSFKLDNLIAIAYKQREQNKRENYVQKNTIKESDLEKYSIPNELTSVDRPDQFMNAISLSMENFFSAFEANNQSSYFYFGDVQKNIFYISDNLKTNFGFNSNIIYNFMQVWGNFIAIAEVQGKYFQNLKDIMHSEDNILDFQCLVRDNSGEVRWIQNYGIVTWDKEKGIPLTISGRITQQNNSFVVDTVTNLPRASVFWDSLNNLNKENEIYNVIGFRFNNITEINHIYGRKYVDRLLRDTAAILLERLSSKMSFYRLEGIQYIAVIDAEHIKEKEILMRQIREIVKDSYNRLGLLFPYPCSIAILEYSPSEMTIDEFRNNLETLVEIAKNTPEKEFVQSSDDTPYAKKKISKLELELNKNILNNMENFRIVVQPLVSAEDGIIKGGEVLLRWEFKGKDISPTIFIPILEKSRMIHVVGRWVFEQTVRTCSRIVSYYPEFYLSFNVSLYQLDDAGFIEYMKKTLDKYHLDAFNLVAEMTESCLDKKPESMMIFIKACKKIGLRLAIDDFGSGYSSMRMLLQYPYNIIKLDRSLLQEVTVSNDSQSFIRGLVGIFHYLNKKVCIEGVETAEENLIVKGTGCDIIQGYYYHKPKEVHQLYELLNKSEY